MSDTPRLYDDFLTSTQTEWGASKFGTWRQCPELYNLKHEKKIVRLPTIASFLDDDDDEDSSHFPTGILVHSGLALEGEKARGQKSHLAPLGWVGLLERATEPPNTYRRGDALEAERLLSSYFGFYGEDNGGYPEGCEVLAVEQWLGVEAGVLGPLPYTARADAVVKLSGGQVVVVDHKTRRSAIPGYAPHHPKHDGSKRQRYARGLRTRPQFAGLSWLVQRDYQLDEPPPVWVNAIIKTKSPAFDRLLVVMHPRDLEWWAREQATTAYGVTNDIDSPGAWAANPANCAPDFGSRCQMFDYCHAPSDEQRAKLFTTSVEKEKEKP